MAVPVGRSEEFSCLVGSFPLPSALTINSIPQIEIEERLEFFKHHPQTDCRVEFEGGQVNVYVRPQDFKHPVPARKSLFSMHPISLFGLMVGFGAACYLAARFCFQVDDDAVWVWTRFGIVFGFLVFVLESMRVGFSVWRKGRG